MALDMPVVRQRGQDVAARADRPILRLGAIGLILLAATLSGEILFAVAENGNASFETLILDVALPSIGVIVLATLASGMLGLRRIVRAVLLGAAFGAVATLPLEVVRNVGFYQFNAMPGQLPELMGVFMTNRIMDGPDLVSNVLGWADHFWNGATLGITFALLFGGTPRQASHWRGAAIGAVFGLVVGTGFLASPVSRATGAGLFGSIMGMKYVITVYLAHLGFGATLGALVHRFGASLEPVWEVALAALGKVRGRVHRPPPLERLGA